jgi:imidazolonepropionase
MIPQVAQERLAEFCDIYCDVGYYTAQESEDVLRGGMKYGLRPRIHTDAYANIGGSSLAAALPAVSADHLNYISKEEMNRLAAAGVVGVVLPALDFAVAHPDPFTARPMIEAGMTLALGTNLNPGNWTESMQLVMQLACRNHGMSPEEAMLAATSGAARAIQREQQIGCLAPGFQADIQVWDLPGFEDVIYRIGNNAIWMVIKNGEIVVRKALS